MSAPQKPPPLRQLRAFEATARCRSVSAAAAAINLSQPGVTQAITGLEEVLGSALLKRGHNGSHLTDTGQILLPRVQRMFAHMQMALCQPSIGMPLANADTAQPVLNRIRSTHVRALIAVAESGSFEGAAGLLGISQPSLHRAARELERVLQRSLYERTARGVNTNPQGAELARRFQIAQREIDYGIDEIRAAQGIVNSRIVIGNIPHSDTQLLSAAINKLLADYPNARVQVDDGHYFRLLRDLRAGKIDLLFGVLRCPAWITDVEEEALFPNHYCVVVRRGHPITHRKRITRQELARYDWIMPDVEAPRRQAFERFMSGLRRPPMVSVETASIAICRMLLAASNRVTLMSRHEARSDENAGLLTTLPFSSPALARSHGLAMRKDWHPTGLHLRFLQLLREQSALNEADAKTNARRGHAGKDNDHKRRGARSSGVAPPLWPSGDEARRVHRRFK